MGGKFADGSFLCCFTGSRCPVNHPLHKTRNVAPYLNDHALDQRCNATVCNITSSLVVGEQHGLENGMCAGEMLWSYAHMHSGAIKASMFINGKKHCENVPTVGTDLNNTPGNEAGFLVRMSECVNENKYGNKVRVNKGDVVTIEALYDVDDSSTRYAPFTGGKHGGIMALFFSVLHCDPGTWGERYVCRNKQCLGVGKGKHLDKSEPQWNTIEDCTKECSDDSPDFLRPCINSLFQCGRNREDLHYHKELRQCTSAGIGGAFGLSELPIVWQTQHRSDCRNSEGC